MNSLKTYDGVQWNQYVRGAGILSGVGICRAVEMELITIDPFRKEHLNPSSIDLTLGNQIRVYNAVVEVDRSKGRMDSGYGIYPVKAVIPCLDVTRDNETILIENKPGDTFLLKPDVLYLCHTVERVCTKGFNPVIDGKSSLGRLGISVHETAGYGEAGFDGQYTLEVTVSHHVLVQIGMRFCQMRFHTIADRVVLYQGHYQGENATGAVSSRTWEQIQEQKDGEG